MILARVFSVTGDYVFNLYKQEKLYWQRTMLIVAIIILCFKYFNLSVGWEYENKKFSC
jgi:hypothetical protein